MDKRLLAPAVQAFIREHEQDDPGQLMLQQDRYPGLPLKEIAGQIKARKKAAIKLPAWYNTPGIIFPTGVAVEQASSAITAQYKAALCQGNSVLDLTGGMGVDSYFFARQFKTVTYVEKNATLAATASHNFTELRQENIQVENTTAEEFLATGKQNYDLVYLDPDRRPQSQRVVGFADSQPNVPALLPQLFAVTEKILVKASPMMDISRAIDQLNQVAGVVVLAVDNEVKELLFLLEKGFSGSPLVRCVNITKNGQQEVEYKLQEENQEICKFVALCHYLYEPNAAIMKAGCFNQLCRQYAIGKLHPNTHLFTANTLIRDFPGRIFKVVANVAYQKKQILPLLQEKKANISTRNFPDSPEQVKQKLGVSDGGHRYLFGYRDLNGKLKIVVSEKVIQSE